MSFASFLLSNLKYSPPILQNTLLLLVLTQVWHGGKEKLRKILRKTHGIAKFRHQDHGVALVGGETRKRKRASPLRRKAISLMNETR